MQSLGQFLLVPHTKYCCDISNNQILYNLTQEHYNYKPHWIITLHGLNDTLSFKYMYFPGLNSSKYQRLVEENANQQLTLPLRYSQKNVNMSLYSVMLEDK